MQINISQETMNVIINSLTATKQDLGRQIKSCTKENKLEIIKHQLAEVTETLEIMMEFDDYYRGVGK